MIERKPPSPTNTTINSLSRFKVVNISDSPRYSSPDFDIIDELISNRSHYLASEGDPTLSILSFPNLCSINLDRLRDHVADESNSKKPGIHATLSACVYYGVSTFLENEHIQSLLTAKTKFNMISCQVDAKIAEIINGMFSTYTLCTNLPRGKRLNIFLPNHIHTPLTSLANNLSSDVSRVHLQSLSVLAIMHTLSLQDDTLEDHSKAMKKYVDDFVQSVGFLNRAIRAVVREFKL